ncbi:MAG: ketol-acid reductoisomerase [Chloroflexi bacterium]|nr:ketol-acid reductoisomerase [Chloroflexota bacterium]MBV9600279.1 ketol-acid reductoisomerase [Chloroflexota bacterium]
MTRYFRDSDASLEPLAHRTVAVLGFGNQGRAQALNLRDSGVQVIVGNVQDEYADRARADNFPTFSIAEASAQADVLLCLIADEITPAIYNVDIQPALTTGKTICFASGYCIRYEQIAFPADVNVVMVAPRIMGDLVRETFLSGRGFLSFLDVHQDADGHAWPLCLALAKGIGTLKRYAIQASPRDETESDLFTEQTLVPAIVAAVATAVEVLVEAGYPKAEALLELYLSGEMGDIMHEAAKKGLVGQTALHSPTSRYGTVSRLNRFKTPELRRVMEDVLGGIQDGSFAREWAADQQHGYAGFLAYQQQLADSDFARAEREVLTEIQS